MTDELETARFDMILEGHEHENVVQRVTARFDLYSRSQSDVDARVAVYHELIQRISPYIDFEFNSTEEEEQLSEDESRKRFLELHRKLVAEGAFKVQSPV